MCQGIDKRVFLWYNTFILSEGGIPIKHEQIRQCAGEAIAVIIAFKSLAVKLSASLLDVQRGSFAAYQQNEEHEASLQDIARNLCAKLELSVLVDLLNRVIPQSGTGLVYLQIAAEDDIERWVHSSEQRLEILGTLHPSSRLYSEWMKQAVENYEE